MPNKLYNILVPVDFSGKNKWAITKAIELANNFHCNIHLVHVVYKPLLPFLPVDRSVITPYESSADLHASRRKLEALKAAYSNQLCGEGKIEISILQGNPRKMLASYIRQYDMDLVVVGLSKFNLLQRIISSISISRLARKTNVPVLAVRSSGLVSHFKKIVLPLHQDIPMRSIKLATILARSFKSTVYLVSLRNQNDHNQAKDILNNALEIVQSLSTIPVQCIFMEGKNLAKSTLEFSKKINADLILVNPVKEFRLPGFWNKITNKLLSYASKIPVITLNQKTPEQQ
ncbi:MAG TPA: universal stress protein [Chitinophagaceae bacterium]|jgi:nucleotide-binding universal stress UspA family protein|nr:universal stress protein [Chitinophagaceae bacterium]